MSTSNATRIIIIIIIIIIESKPRRFRTFPLFKRYLKKTFDKTCPSEWLFDCLTKNNNISLAVCQAVYLEPLSAIEDFERKKGFATFLACRVEVDPLISPAGVEASQRIVGDERWEPDGRILMSGAWTGARG